MTLVVLREPRIKKTSGGAMKKDPEWPLAESGSVRLEMAAVDCGLLRKLKERPFAGPTGKSMDYKHKSNFEVNRPCLKRQRKRGKE